MLPGLGAHPYSSFSMERRKLMFSPTLAALEKVQPKAPHSWRAISWKAHRSSVCTRPASRTTPTTGDPAPLLNFAWSSASARSTTCAADASCWASDVRSLQVADRESTNFSRESDAAGEVQCRVTTQQLRLSQEH